MPDHEFDEPNLPQQREQPTRNPEELQCIGSFVARTPEGQPHTIEIWARYHAVHEHHRLRVMPGLIVLTTTDAHDVDYVAKGVYRLHDHPEVELFSSDPEAP